MLRPSIKKWGTQHAIVKSSPLIMEALTKQWMAHPLLTSDKTWMKEIKNYIRSDFDTHLTDSPLILACIGDPRSNDWGQPNAESYKYIQTFQYLSNAYLNLKPCIQYWESHASEAAWFSSEWLGVWVANLGGMEKIGRWTGGGDGNILSLGYTSARFTPIA